MCTTVMFSAIISCAYAHCLVTFWCQSCECNCSLQCAARACTCSGSPSNVLHSTSILLLYIDSLAPHHWRSNVGENHSHLPVSCGPATLKFRSFIMVEMLFCRHYFMCRAFHQQLLLSTGMLTSLPNWWDSDSPCMVHYNWLRHSNPWYPFEPIH